MRVKIKKTIILAVSCLMVAVFMTSLSMIDSESVIPYILFAVSLGWLALVAKANGWCDDHEI